MKIREKWCVPAGAWFFTPPLVGPCWAALVVVVAVVVVLVCETDTLPPFGLGMSMHADLA